LSSRTESVGLGFPSGPNRLAKQVVRGRAVLLGDPALAV
jgi:hypothetical protein